MSKPESLHLVRGTLDLLVLKALSDGAQHGYAVSQWIRGATKDTIMVEEGSLYPALHRLEGKGFIKAEWGESPTGRRARLYELTAEGRAHLEDEVETWERYSRAIDRAISTQGQEI